VLGISNGAIVAHAASLGQMRDLGTKLCMSSLGNKADGAVVRQEACNGSNNQYWFGTSVLGGLNLQNMTTDHCLNNAGGAATSGNPQTLWPCNGAWKITYKYAYFAGTSGGIHLAVSNSALNPNGYCISSNGNTHVGSPVVEEPCNKSANQMFSGPINLFSGSDK